METDASGVFIYGYSFFRSISYSCNMEMRSNQLKYIAELAFVKSMPDLVKTKPGRMRNLLSRLAKIADKKLMQFNKRISDAELQTIHDKIYSFSTAAGWEHNPKSLYLLVNFLLLLCEENEKLSEFVRLLNEVSRFLENREIQELDPCLWDSAVALTQWQAVWNVCTGD